MENRLKYLYNTYGAMVHRRCKTLLGNEADAFDCMQEVFLKLVEKQLVLNHKYPSTLLYRMATNMALNKIRDGKNRESIVKNKLLYTIAHYTEPHKRVDAQLLLAKLFNINKASTKEIAVLYFLDGYTLEEVAEIVKMSVSGVRKRISLLRESIETLELQ